MYKLGPHFLDGGQDATLAWLAIKPTVAKFCFNGFELAQSADPATITIGRPDENFLGTCPICSCSPVEAAQKMIEQIYVPHIRAYPYIQVWEGPNEVGIGKDEIDRMQWYSAFLAVLGRGVHDLGRRALLGAWAVGTPEFTLWEHYTPVLEACRDYGAILSRHCYGPLDEWYSYRHQRDQDAFRDLGFNPQVIISECGSDKAGSYKGGWRKMWGNEQDYWREHLSPFTKVISADDYILGATVFTVGNGFAPAWDAFNVGQITINGILKDAPQVKEPIMTDPTLFSSHGIVGRAFKVENPVVDVGQDVWFDFTVENTLAVPAAYSALAAHTDVGYTAWSWTMQRLQPGQVLKWRDRIKFDKAGTYQLYLGICYAGSVEECRTAKWDRLSSPATVQVGQVVTPPPVVTPPVETTKATPLFQCRTNPLRLNFATMHPGCDEIASGFRQPGYDIDVWEVKLTASGIWYRVTEDGALWMMAQDCVAK